MRDIRSDLQERAAMIGEHIKATQGQFEMALERLKREHEGKVKDLRAELEAVNVLLGMEQRRHAAASPPSPALSQPQTQGAKTPPPLPSLLMRRAG
jgi:hypothetical protein